MTEEDVETKWSNYGIVDSEGNVLMHIAQRISRIDIMLYKSNGDTGNPIVAMRFSKT